MAEEKEPFLSRWSRLKAENRVADEKAETPAPALPPVDKLTPDSEFSGFMHPKVEDALRRAALRKLFSDPHFNVPDPFEPYSVDFTVAEPISEEMLATLNQARTLLFDNESKKEEPQLADTEAAKEEPKHDESGRKDT
jgi:hypothetical protein